MGKFLKASPRFKAFSLVIPAATLAIVHAAFLHAIEGKLHPWFALAASFVPDFYRVLFKADRGRTWQVHLPSGVTSYALPDLTEAVDGWEDRTLDERVSLIAVSLSGDSETDYAGLISTGSPNMDTLIDWVDAFSVVEIGD